MRFAPVAGIVAVLLVTASPAGAAPACLANGIFANGNAAQAWVWTLHDRGGAIAGGLRYAANGRTADARVAGKRTGSTLHLTLVDSAGRAHHALAGVTCSRPTAQIPIDEILFVRVAGPVPHLAFDHTQPAGEAALLAAARRRNARLPAPPRAGLEVWLRAMDAVAR